MNADERRCVGGLGSSGWTAPGLPVGQTRAPEPTSMGAEDGGLLKCSPPYNIAQHCTDVDNKP